MTSDQAEQIIRLLEKIDQTLSYSHDILTRIEEKK